MKNKKATWVSKSLVSSLALSVFTIWASSADAAQSDPLKDLQKVGVSIEYRDNTDIHQDYCVMKLLSELAFEYSALSKSGQDNTKKQMHKIALNPSGHTFSGSPLAGVPAPRISWEQPGAVLINLSYEDFPGVTITDVKNGTAGENGSVNYDHVNQTAKGDMIRCLDQPTLLDLLVQ